MLTSEAVKVMVDVMAPFVGDTMARSAAEAHCLKLGIADGAISSEQVEALLARLGSGLNIFLGREKSSSVVDQMRAAVGVVGEAR